MKMRNKALLSGMQEPQGRKQENHGGIGMRFCVLIAEVWRRVGFYVLNQEFSKCSPQTWSIGNFLDLLNQTLKGGGQQSLF